MQIQPQENYISLSWHQKDYVETKELEPSKPREDPTPIQHHTTYCQKEPFVETQNLFLHFARADFRDVDWRGACSVWNILRIGGYRIHLQVFEGKAHEAKDPWLQANQAIRAIQDIKIIATFITFWLCRPPLLVELAPSLGMSKGLMSIPPSTDPRLTQQELRTCLKQRTRTHPEPVRVYVFWVTNVGGEWRWQASPRSPRSNQTSSCKLLELLPCHFRLNDLLPWRRNSGEETVHFRFGFEMLASKTALWMQLELCQLRFPGIQLMMNWW